MKGIGCCIGQNIVVIAEYTIETRPLVDVRETIGAARSRGRDRPASPEEGQFSRTKPPKQRGTEIPNTRSQRVVHEGKR